MAQENQAPAAPEVVVAKVEAGKCPTPPPAEPVEEKKEEADVDVGGGGDVCVEASEKCEKVVMEQSASEKCEKVVMEQSASEKCEKSVIEQSASFKEESNVVADLGDHEKKALEELKELIVAALANNEFTKPPAKEEEKKEEVGEEEEEKEKKEEEVGEEKEKAKKEDVRTCETHEQPKESEKERLEETEKGKEPMKPEPCAPAPSAMAEEKKEIGDGAKTVEAIETTMVQATAAAATPELVKEGKKPEVVEEGKKPEVVEEGKKPEVVEEGKKPEVVEEGKKPEVVEEEKTMPQETCEAAGEEEEEKIPPPPPEQVFIWGVPLLGSEKSDTILLKFLRARDFKVKEALTMIKETVIWRKEFGIDALLDEDLGLPELEKAVFMRGLDKERHPVWYNVLGEFQDKEMYQKIFGDEQKRENFSKWIVQLLEKEIREKLDFSPEGVCTIVQVNDLKNLPYLWRKEFRQTTFNFLHLFQNNYPEFAAKQIFINVSWWVLPFFRMIAPFFTLRSKSKFVYAGPPKSAETLFKYIPPEQVPVQYGGLSMDGDTEFCTADPVNLVSIKPTTKHIIEIPVTEACILVWELRVLSWNVCYGAEFEPDAEGAYSVMVQKMRKVLSTDEAVEKNSFVVGEPGKVILSIDNATSKKKKLLYRYKIKSKSD